MSDFDPYHLWLQIPPEEQPPTLYRLLGLANFESDSDVIDNAADQRMLHLRNAQNGPQGQTAQQLMNEVSKARLTLLDAAKRAAYDRELKQRLAAKQPRPPQQVENTESSPLPSHLQPARATTPSNPTPQLVSTRTTTKSMAYARKRKKSAAMVWLTIVGGLAIVGGIVFYLVSNSGNQGQEQTADKQADQDQANKKNKSSRSDQANKSDKNSNASQKKNSRSNPPVKQKTNRQSNDQNRTNKNSSPNFSSNSDHDPQNLDNLFATTFSPESEGALAAGEPISMMPMLKFPECLNHGVARKEKSAVIFESTLSMNQISFPVLLPTSYDLETTVTRLSSEDGFGIGIHLANQPCLLMIDCFPRRGFLTGLREIQYSDINTSSRSDVVHGQLLELDEPTPIKIAVRPTGVQLFIKEEKVYEWKGDPNSLKLPPEFMPGTSRKLLQLWMMSWNTRFQFEDVKLIPRGDAAKDSNWLAKSQIETSETVGTPVDLMKKFDPTRIMVPPVVKNRFGLTLGPGNRSGVEIPAKLASEYDLRITARLGGPEGFAVMLPIADHRVGLMIDQKVRFRKDTKIQTGLQMIFRRNIGDSVHPGFLPVKVLPVNKDVPLDIKVRQDSIRLYVDDKFVYGWSGASDQLSPPRWKNYPADTGQDYLRLISFSNPILIKKLSYRPVLKSDHVELKDMISQLQTINPSLTEFWKDYQSRKGQSGFSSPNSGTGSSTTKTVGKKSTSNNASDISVDDIDLTGLNLDTARLKWRSLSDEEKKEIDQLKLNVKSIVQTLEEKDWDAASSEIKLANEKVTEAEPRKMIAGIAQVSRDLNLFWQQMPARCALLKPTEQLEFSDSIAVVISASSSEIRVRTSGENKTYSTDELPLGLAMKIFEVTSQSKNKVHYRVRGSVFFFAACFESKFASSYLRSALENWLEAEKQGSDIDELLALLRS